MSTEKSGVVITRKRPRIDDLTCDICESKFSSAKDLWEHEDSAHKIHKPICFFCGECFEDKKGIIRHMKMVHGRLDQLDDVRSRNRVTNHTCSVCKVNYFSLEGLKRHRRQAHNLSLSPPAR